MFLALPVLLLLSSCYPVQKAEDEFVWDGPMKNGTRVAIKAERTQKYLRLPVSPEGQHDVPLGKSRYRYFIGSNAGYSTPWSNLVELPWLELEVQHTNGWQQMLPLDGTPYWIAYRHIESDEPKTIDKGPGLPWRDFEIIVFSRTGMKTKRNITATDWPGGSQSGYSAWKYNPSQKTLEYKSPNGRKRYHCIEGVEEPAGPEVRSSPTATSPSIQQVYFVIPVASSEAQNSTPQTK